MNPLNRKMFRQPGMSRQPMGILASSPELANVVRRRMGQPVQMVHGGYHPPGDPMGSADANERKFREGLNRGLIPDLLSKYANSTGPSVMNRGIAAAKSAVSGDYMRPLTDAIVKGVRSDLRSLRPKDITDFELPKTIVSEEDSPNERLLASEILGGRRDAQFMGDTRDPNLDVNVGVGVGKAGLGVEPPKPKKTDPIEDQVTLPKTVVSEEDSPLGITVPKKTNVVSVEKLEALQDESLMGTQKDEMFAGEINNVLNSDLSNEEKNDGILEITGAKDPNKKLTTEERVKANIELYEKYLGADASDKYDMNDAAIDFGLALASGDSPDLLTNVVNAAKSTLGKFREDKKTRKARKDKLKLLGLTKAFDDEKDERQWSRELQKIDRSEKYDWKKTLFTNKKDAERFDAKMAFDRTALISKLNTQIDVANANADNAAIRDKANNEAALLRAKIGALPDGHAAAFLEFEGRDFTDAKVTAAFHKRADEIATNLAKNKATSQTRKGYGVGEVEVLIANAVQDQINAMIRDGFTPTEKQREEITRQVRGTYATALAQAQGTDTSTKGGFKVTRKDQEG